MTMTITPLPARPNGAQDEPHGPRRLRVVLADDHAVVRMGLKTLIDAQSDMEVVGEANDGNDAFARARSTQPDIVVMDVSMPGMNGVQATSQIKALWPNIRILALSMHEDKSYLRELLEAGAAGYILKRSAAEELVRAIRAVASGGMYLDPALSDAVAETLVRGSKPALRGQTTGASLSERESEVLRLIAQGYTNKEIAVKLKVSVKTVETYKSRSTEKLGLDGRAEIVRYALSQGWLRHADV